MKTLLFSLLFCPTLSFAALGQGRASVSNDLRALGAEPIVGAQALTAHPEIHIDAVRFFSQVIKEYSDANGNIFAITWSGTRHPNLEPLLADYYAEFRRLDNITKKGRRYARKPFVTSQITVIRGGHLGNFHGVAYLTGHLPKGITLETLNEI